LAITRATPGDNVERTFVKQNASLIAQHYRIALFVRPFFPRLSQPYTWTAAVFVDELDASFLKGSSYDIKGRATWLAPLLFELMDGHDADARTISQVLLAPTKQASGCSTLSGCDHPPIIRDSMILYKSAENY